MYGFLQPADSAVKNVNGKKRSKNSVFIPEKDLYLHKYNSNLPMILSLLSGAGSTLVEFMGGYYSTTPR